MPLSFIPGPPLHESKTVWEILHETLQTVAAKCLWKEVTRSKIVGPKLSPKQRWAFLDKFSKGRELAIGPFYVAVLLFFQMVWEYYAAVKGLDDSAGGEHTPPHYTTLHYTTPHLHHTTPHHTTLHHTTPHYTTLHHTTLHHTTLHHSTLHHTTLHYITLFYSKVYSAPHLHCVYCP